MNLQQFLLTLRARFGVFGIVLAVTIAVAVLTSLVMPKSYKATVSLLMDAKNEQSLGNALQPLIIPQEKLSYMQTQMDILTSKKVAGKVVEDLKLADNPAKRTAFADHAGGAGSIEDWLVKDLLDHLKVETSQSNVIKVSASSTDPRFSAAVANAFAKAYIDRVLELRVGPTREAAEWFNEQLKSLRASVENAQDILTDYRKLHGIVSDDERSDVDNARLSTLSEEAAKAQAQTYQWDVRAQQAGELLEKHESADRLPEVLDNPFIQKLKMSILEGEAKLRNLSAQYGSNYPLYQQQAAENRSLREKLDSETKKLLQGVESSARQSRLRESELKNAIAGQRAAVLDQRDNRNELAVLKHNVESAMQAYDTAKQRFVVNQVESRANQTNVIVLDPAVPPSRPSRPNILLNTVLSAIVGAMLGIGVVMLLEMLDRRVRSPKDLELDGLELDVPLLGEINTWRHSGGGLFPGSASHNSRLPNPG